MNTERDAENEQISILKTVNELHQKNVRRLICCFLLLIRKAGTLLSIANDIIVSF